MKVVISLEVSSWDELKALIPAIEPLFQKGAKVEVEKPAEKPVVKPPPAEKTKPLPPQPQQEQAEQETTEDDCFGTYEASDPACQQCGVAKKCKAETLKKKSQPRETEEGTEDEETSVEVEAEAGTGGEIPDISSAPTLKEAVKTLMKAGIDDEEEIIDIITRQKDELEFELPANWKEKVKRLLILLK